MIKYNVRDAVAFFVGKDDVWVEYLCHQQGHPPGGGEARPRQVVAGVLPKIQERRLSPSRYLTFKKQLCTLVCALQI